MYRIYNSENDCISSAWKQIGENINREDIGDSGFSVSLNSDENTVTIRAADNKFYSGHIRVLN